MGTYEPNIKTLIPGTTGYYATEDGDIFSTNNSIRGESMKQLKSRVNNCGYLQIMLGNNGGLKFKNKLCSIHRLIATTFISNPENKPQVNHKNGNKSDNRVENLEWSTASENIQHAIATGLLLAAKGEDQGSSKITNKEAITLIDRILNGATNEELALEFDLHSRYISLIRHKKRWAWLWESHFKGKVAKKSFKDLKKDVIDRDLITKEVLTTTEPCSSIAKRHKIDKSVLTRLRAKSVVPNVWEPYITKYENLRIVEKEIEYENIVNQLLGTSKSTAQIAKDFEIGTSALIKVRAGKPPKKWKLFVEMFKQNKDGKRATTIESTLV